ncbi:hypothetical protein GCM10027162_70960 [Streptomyces incanus]
MPSSARARRGPGSSTAGRAAAGAPPCVTSSGRNAFEGGADRAEETGGAGESEAVDPAAVKSVLSGGIRFPSCRKDIMRARGARPSPGFRARRARGTAKGTLGVEHLSGEGQ